jgi:hypothetical protein
MAAWGPPAAGFKSFAVIDLSTIGGRYAASTAHVAQASGRTISIDGAGACALYSGFETVGDIREQ